MNFALTLVVAVIGYANVLVKAQGTELYSVPSNYGGLEDMVVDVIHQIRDQLRKGIPEWDFPPLDPLDLKYQKVDLDFQPFINLHGSLRNVHAENFLGFNISSVKLSVLPVGFQIGINWEPVRIGGDYDIDGNVFSIVPIYGNGSFQGNVSGGFIFFKIEIGTKSLRLFVKKLEIDFGIDDIQVNIENFLGGLLGEIICEIINENLVTMIKQFKFGYLEGIKNGVKDFVNDAIKGLTMQELIDFIMSLLPKPETTTSPQTTTTSTTTTTPETTTTPRTTTTTPEATTTPRTTTTIPEASTTPAASASTQLHT